MSAVVEPRTQAGGNVADMSVKLAFSKKLQAVPQVFITHLKPGEGALTMKEVSEAAGRWRPRMLENNQEFSL